MDGYDPFDDQSALPRWATITQVCAFLGVPRGVVRHAVRRAMQHGEPWVTKEMAEGKPVRMVIDTSHETYQAYAQQWKQEAAFDRVHEPFPSLKRYAFLSERLAQPSWFPPVSSKPGLKGGMLHTWPAFRRWLYDLGLLVFTNVLADEEQAHPWHWQVGDRHGEGYEDEEEAIIGALQSLLDAQRPEEEAPLVSSAVSHKGSSGSWLDKFSNVTRSL